jgi:hypothetical protein
VDRVRKLSMSNSIEGREFVAALAVRLNKLTSSSRALVNFPAQILIVGSPEHHAAGAGFHVGARVDKAVVEIVECSELRPGSVARHGLALV